MSDLRSSLFESLNRLRPELSPSAQAQLVVPIGTVADVREAFEARIANHQYERDSVLITRAVRNTNELILQERTYAQQLRLVESIGLSHLPSHLLDFIRDHDNVYRATIRHRHLANVLDQQSSQVDVLTRVGIGIVNANNVYCLNTICATRSPAERTRMMHDPMFNTEIEECTSALVDEMFRIVQRTSQLYIILTGDVELENIGPDHDINDFGYQLPVPAGSALPATTDFYLSKSNEHIDEKLDHAQRCCICLSPYHSGHAGFKLNLCGHIIGTPCLSTWLNSTATNSTTCPYCRASLCARRARQVSGSTQAAYSEQMQLSQRLDRALALLDEIDALDCLVYGTDGEVFVAERMQGALVEVNRRCFENGVEVGFVRDAVTVSGWGLRRMDWARE
ncbi:hypothetical protein EK21DRAFT_109083 [Setomelanomma holmii]|uniref:RING-type domain-containing protein n=1 Tax=Setomelanomma holmii TaxID=210430 RepID=A0A9P4LQJ3_9PLEO|nr:hypothetical protein EK21DRAFT_109083 [Setomelanomma holmii]